MYPILSSAQPTRSVPRRRLPAALLLCSLLLAPAIQAVESTSGAATTPNATAPGTSPASTAASPSAAATPPAAGAPALPATDAPTDPATAAAGQPAGEAGAAAPADASSAAVPGEAEEPAESGLAHDLSPWGMYQNADIVVKGVMIGLLLASVVTWTIWMAKGLELLGARRRLQRSLADIKGLRTLDQASALPSGENCLRAKLIADAREELQLSAGTIDKDGIKERVSFRLERLVAECGRKMSVGTGVLATIGSTSPFVGLFGTVWGIMNSFIGIAKSQTTNLAVVAPGIAEALLATAIGLVAAIPAVIIYNVFARSIAAYKAQVANLSSEVLLLVSRDLDQPSNVRQSPAPVSLRAAVE
ncbi:tonB-system proton channel, ExbB [Azotobacter vinelandii CA]|uniref:Biopolymer transport protein ExbB n=2 Tax=Azotobacter vinelandii TaxID=354 RepID=C1DNS8_AZOVD|nr:tonB-system energizer ExbB [Azotobacter vinelandii]ACO77294.1 tonB-system proton channel, ExbB [Azotobacter vinelandii DJ]AGK17107.1 tonB-system proton channel, ExbB [Azotobacter vinelandii CA]AGK19699.1 tonB-system proton channel, ExbB [Azotobacter vinelandii CA6]WKN22972.1 tonB-system energizer ExbB [Azotobacter vinelandii]SFX62471.1 outer membrane transport energization protein ExbB [Azotobacter vinelandii]